jgi:predicted esterase
MSDTGIHHIETKKTARFFTLGNLSSQTKHVWLVLHGYGQLAEYFIRNFKIINNDENFIVAPEGLSRFYLNETTGRIGATWMTKEDREYEINDYLEYLDNVINSLNISSNCNIHVLGFSQGAATACRWTMHTEKAVNTLICWAGFFPPDMQWSSPKYLKDTLSTYLLYGTKDEYVNDDLKKQIEHVIAAIEKKPNIIIFEGKHEIVDSTLHTLAKTLENK